MRHGHYALWFATLADLERDPRARAELRRLRDDSAAAFLRHVDRQLLLARAILAEPTIGPPIVKRHRPRPR